jgi:hypothetical protein
MIRNYIKTEGIVFDNCILLNHNAVMRNPAHILPYD